MILEPVWELDGACLYPSSLIPGLFAVRMRAGGIAGNAVTGKSESIDHRWAAYGAAPTATAALNSKTTTATMMTMNTVLA